MANDSRNGRTVRPLNRRALIRAGVKILPTLAVTGLALSATSQAARADCFGSCHAECADGCTETCKGTCFTDCGTSCGGCDTTCTGSAKAA